MYKKYLLFVIFILVGASVMAQVRLGLKASPNLIINRIKGGDDAMNLKSDGISFRPSFTLFADLPISQNYYFNTGIGYIPKSMKFTSTNLANEEVDSEYIAQYIELPLALKLYTNEVDLDKRVYLKIGTNIDIKVYDENKGTEEIISSIRPVDMTLHLGAGVEIYLGTNTSFLVGLSYQRGLINVVSESSGGSDFSLKNDLVGIDFGLKL